MRQMRSAEGAIFFQFKLVRRIFFILGGGVIATFACTTCEGNYISHILPYTKNHPALFGRAG
jgi:hypothetical protein